MPWTALVPISEENYYFNSHFLVFPCQKTIEIHLKVITINWHIWQYLGSIVNIILTFQVELPKEQKLKWLYLDFHPEKDS